MVKAGACLKSGPQRFALPGEHVCKYVRVRCLNNVRGGNIVNVRYIVIKGLLRGEMDSKWFNFKFSKHTFWTISSGLCMSFVHSRCCSLNTQLSINVVQNILFPCIFHLWINSISIHLYQIWVVYILPFWMGHDKIWNTTLRSWMHFLQPVYNTQIQIR